MRNSKGFTLIELIGVIILIGILAPFCFTFINQGFQSYINTHKLLDSDATITTSLERMQRDLRQVRSINDMITSGLSTLSFVNISGQTITYSLSSGNLLRQTNTNTAQILASGVTSLLFTYYDSNLLVTTVPSAVTYVSVTMALPLNSASFIASTGVYLRNVL